MDAGGGPRSRCFPFDEWAVDARACRVSFAPRGQGHGGRGCQRCPSSVRWVAQRLVLVKMEKQISLREIEPGGNTSPQPLLPGGFVMGQGSRKSTVCASRSIQARNQATAGCQSLEPKPMRLDLGRRLPDDGQ